MLWNTGKKMFKKVDQKLCYSQYEQGVTNPLYKRKKRAPFYGVLKHSTDEKQELFYSMQIYIYFCKLHKLVHTNWFLQMDDMR